MRDVEAVQRGHQLVGPGRDPLVLGNDACQGFTLDHGEFVRPFLLHLFRPLGRVEVPTKSGRPFQNEVDPSLFRLTHMLDQSAEAQFTHGRPRSGLLVGEVLDGEEKEFTMPTQALEEIRALAGDGGDRCVHDVFLRSWVRAL